MTPLVIQLPLDPSGTSPNNLVVDEPCTLTANRTFRVIAPAQGAFFAESLKVVDAATGQQLTDGTNGTVEQYYACEYYEQPSARYGKEIDAIILIKDPTVSNNVLITYQALGGPYGTSAQAIIQQIEQLGLDNRPVAWGDIIGKPSEYPPSYHLHDVGDVYGFEFWVHALDRIRDAILVGDQASHEAIYRYIDAAIAALENANAALQQQLNNHLSDFNNPHRVTPAQLGVYTTAQVDALLSAINTTLNNHINNLNNPHQVTAAQTGAYTKAQTDSNISAAVNPVSTALTAHTGNLNNPHQVTVQQLNTYDGPTIDSKITTAVNAVKLGYTPVQQGGGARQGTNKVYIGWAGSSLALQVDSSDLGNFILSPQYNSDITNINNALAGKAPNYGDYAYTGRNQSVSFWDMTSNGTIRCNNDIWAFLSDGRLKENFQKEEDPLALIWKLNAGWYNFTDEAERLAGPSYTPNKKHFGWIAQDFQQVFPAYTGPAPFDTDEKGNSITGKNFITIQAEKAVPLMGEGIKVLDTRTQRLEDQVKRLTELLSQRGLSQD